MFLREMLNIFVSGLCIDKRVAFRILGLKPSGPRGFNESDILN